MSVLTEKIYRELKRDIESKNIVDGNSKLWPENRLADKYQVSIGTLRKTVNRLVEENYVHRVQGSGTFVNSFDRSNNNYRCGVFFSLHNQEELNSHIFQNDPITFSLFANFTYDVLSENMEDFNFAFFSPLQVFYYKNDTNFAPVPLKYVKQIESDFSEKILEPFRTQTTGTLYGLPIIANPSLFYINKKLFAKANIPLPNQDWSWQDFIQISRQLKDAGIMPFLSLPIAELILEPFLQQANGQIFDQYGNVDIKGFQEYYDLLRIFYKEQMIIDGYSLPHNYPYEFAHDIAAMTIAAPFLGAKLNSYPECDWCYQKMPKNQNSFSKISTMGIGVPLKNNNPNEVWEYIMEVVYPRLTIMAEISNSFPARISEQKNWNNSCSRNSEIVYEIVKEATLVHNRKGFYNQNIICEKILSMIANEIPCDIIQKVFVDNLKQYNRKDF